MPKLTPGQEIDRIEAYASGDMRAAVDLLDAHEGRIRRAVRPAAAFHLVDIEDLVQVGRLALLESTEDWLEGRLWPVARRAVVRAAFVEVAHAAGVSESTFRRIARAVRESHGDREAARAFAASPERGSQRVAPETFDAVHEALGDTVDVASGTGTPAPAPGIDATTVRLMSEVEEAAHVLDDRERHVLTRSFGLGQESVSDSVIAEDLDVDRSRIVRIRARALEKLREEIGVSA